MLQKSKVAGSQIFRENTKRVSATLMLGKCSLPRSRVLVRNTQVFDPTAVAGVA
jgi:hypothetical protein